MNLYLVTRTDYVDWDEYDSFVVACENAEKARNTKPANYGWTTPDQVKVTLIGMAAEGIEGIQCASFNAG